MAKTVADIAIGVTADIGPLMRETSRATVAISQFGKIAQGMGGALQSAGAKATDLGRKMSIVTGVVAAAGAGMLALTRNAANMGEEVANAAKAAGMSTTAYQEYRYALSEAADMSGEEFAAATVKLNKRLGEAAAGSKSAQAAFDALGISAADIASGTVTTDEAMAALVATLEQTTDPAKAAALAADVLGKAGARMGGMLSGTAGQVDELRARAQALGIVMSKDATEASDKFNEQWDATVQQLDAVKIAIAENLMPVIVNDLIPLIQNTVIPAIVQIINKIGEWVQVFQDFPGPVKTAIEAVAGLFVVGGPLLIAIGTAASVIGEIVLATGPIGLLIAAAGLLTAAWAIWGDDFKAAVGAAVDYVTGKFKDFMALVQSVIDTLKEWATLATDFTPSYRDRGGDPNGPAARLPSGNAPSGAPGIRGVGGSDALGGGAGSDMLDGGAGNDTLGTEPPRVTRARAVYAQLQQLEVDHQAVMAETQATAEDQRLKDSESYHSSMATIADAFGGKILQAYKAYAAAEAEVNATRALLQTFADPTLTFATKFAAVAAMAKATAGLVSSLGGGSRGRGGSSGATAAASTPANANITIYGDTMKTSSVKDLIDQLNSGFKQGYKLNLVTA